MWICKIYLLVFSICDKIASSKGLVYYGPKKDMQLLKNIADETDLTINFLDSDNNSVKNLKAGTLYRYKDGKRVNVLSGYVPADELVKFLKENKVI